MTEQTPPSGAHAYAAAGVDLEAADKARNAAANKSPPYRRRNFLEPIDII